MDPNNHNEPDPAQAEDPGWAEKPENVRRMIVGTIILCVLVVVADFFYDKHGHYGFEDVTGFHALYGFLSYVGLVLIAGQLRKLLKREEDYYD